MKLIDTARELMKEDTGSVLDTILGTFLIGVCSAFLMIAVAVVLITVPIWGLPYLLIKSYGSKKDG